MSLRRALRADVPRIMEIYNQAIAERIATCDESEKSLSDRLQWFEQFKDRYPLFVEEHDGDVRGYGCLNLYSPKSGYRFATESSIYIDRKYRWQGLGKIILAHLIETALARDFVYIEARIFAHNPVSLRLHENFGFRRIGLQKAIANLDGQWYDNVIYALDLRT